MEARREGRSRFRVLKQIMQRTKALQAEGHFKLRYNHIYICVSSNGPEKLLPNSGTIAYASKITEKAMCEVSF